MRQRVSCRVPRGSCFWYSGLGVVFSRFIASLLAYPISLDYTLHNSCADIILCLSRRFLLSLPASRHSPAHPKIPLSPLVATLTGTSQKSAKSDLVTPLLSILLLHSFSLFFTHVTISQPPPSLVVVETLPLPAHLIFGQQSRYNQSFEQEGNTCHD